MKKSKIVFNVLYILGLLLLLVSFFFDAFVCTKGTEIYEHIRFLEAVGGLGSSFDSVTLLVIYLLLGYGCYLFFKNKKEQGVILSIAVSSFTLFSCFTWWSYVLFDRGNDYSNSIELGMFFNIISLVLFVVILIFMKLKKEKGNE